MAKCFALSLFRTFCLDTKSTQKVKAEGCFLALAYAPPRPSASPTLLELLNMFRESLLRIRVRWPGKKAGVRWHVSEEHFFALTFFRSFLCQDKKEQEDR